MKFKEGDKVRIVANINEHKFELGAVVTLKTASEDSDGDDSYRAEDDKGEYWWVGNSEIELI